MNLAYQNTEATTIAATFCHAVSSWWCWRAGCKISWKKISCYITSSDASSHFIWVQYVILSGIASIHSLLCAKEVLALWWWASYIWALFLTDCKGALEAGIFWKFDVNLYLKITSSQTGLFWSMQLWSISVADASPGSQSGPLWWSASYTQDVWIRRKWVLTLRCPNLSKVNNWVGKGGGERG